MGDGGAFMGDPREKKRTGRQDGSVPAAAFMRSSGNPSGEQRPFSQVLAELQSHGEHVSAAHSNGYQIMVEALATLHQELITQQNEVWGNTSPADRAKIARYYPEGIIPGMLNDQDELGRLLERAFGPDCERADACGVDSIAITKRILIDKLRSPSSSPNTQVARAFDTGEITSIARQRGVETVMEILQQFKTEGNVKIELDRLLGDKYTTEEIQKFGLINWANREAKNISRMASLCLGDVDWKTLIAEKQGQGDKG